MSIKNKLDVIDTIVDTDCVTNTSQLRLNLVQRIACAKTKYIAGITPPNVACAALEFAHNRIRKSFELREGVDLFESLPSRVCCRASTTNSTAKSRSTSLYNAGSSSRGGCRALQLYSALQRSISLQRSTLYILYTLPQVGGCRGPRVGPDMAFAVPTHRGFAATGHARQRPASTLSWPLVEPGAPRGAGRARERQGVIGEHAPVYFTRGPEEARGRQPVSRTYLLPRSFLLTQIFWFHSLHA